MTRPRLLARACSVVAPRSAALALVLLVGSATSDHLLAATDGAPRTWSTKTALTSLGADAAEPPIALCSARLVEGSSELALLCRHELGADGLLSLVRAGSGARSEPALWSAPLASPFEAVVPLGEEALAALLAGELALRIESPAASGVVAEGPLGTPIFDSGFDTFSLCDWSNFPCPSDGNVCTDEVCSSTGVCSHPSNGGTCPIPNGTGGCFSGNCSVWISCNSGYSHCDFNVPNGCEVDHDNLSGTCANHTPEFVGSKGGDMVCGIGCPDYVAPDFFASRTGRGEGWYQARALENSDCPGDLFHYVLLDVPEGIDYDLFLYRNCVLVDSSVGVAGVDETVEVTEIESSGSDDTFYYVVEVRYFSGHSCEEWTLDFAGKSCD